MKWFFIISEHSNNLIRPFDELYDISTKTGMIKGMIDIRDTMENIDMNQKLESQLELQNQHKSDNQDHLYDEPEHLIDKDEDGDFRKDDESNLENKENVVEIPEMLNKVKSSFRLSFHS